MANAIPFGCDEYIESSGTGGPEPGHQCGSAFRQYRHEKHGNSSVPIGNAAGVLTRFLEGNNMLDSSSPEGSGNFEIGRILHLKSEIRNFQLNQSPGQAESNVIFRISDLRCRIRPISKCLLRWIV